jgi:single-stranded-DNA-specific exonuclease
LTSFGGHQQAAGFTARLENVEALVQRLRQSPALTRGATDMAELRIDVEMSPFDADWRLFDQMQIIEPCGVGNPIPLFLGKRLRLRDFRCFGNNHLELTFRRGGMTRKVIAFRRGDLARYLYRNHEIDLVYSIEVNDWEGERALQLRMHDMAFEPAYQGDSDGYTYK